MSYVSVRNAVPFGDCFCKSQGCPVLSVPSQYSVQYIIGEQHCLVTIFDGQAILSSDYFTHGASFLCCLC